MPAAGSGRGGGGGGGHGAVPGGGGGGRGGGPSDPGRAHRARPARRLREGCLGDRVYARPAPSAPSVESGRAERVGRRTTPPFFSNPPGREAAVPAWIRSMEREILPQSWGTQGWPRRPAVWKGECATKRKGGGGAWLVLGYPQPGSRRQRHCTVAGSRVTDAVAESAAPGPRAAGDWWASSAPAAWA